MTHPLSTRSPGAIVNSNSVRVALAAPCARFSLRARGDVSVLEAALSVVLPRTIGQRSRNEDRHVICLGPDEWLIKTAPEDATAIASAADRVYPSHIHSLVDVSGREISLVVEGERAAELLTIGMARDPETILPGEGRRLNFDGVTVVLWRDASDRFEMDIWHSFAPHVLGLLETGLREFEAEYT